MWIALRTPHGELEQAEELTDKENELAQVTRIYLLYL